MPQNRQVLLDSLAALRRQIDTLPGVDPALAEQLKATLADIEAALVEPASLAPARQPTLAARLSAATRDFEDSHPALSGTVASLIDALAGMGI